MRVCRTPPRSARRPAPAFRVQRFRFSVSGSAFRVSDFWFQGFGSRGSGLVFRVSDSGFQVSGLGVEWTVAADEELDATVV